MAQKRFTYANTSATLVDGVTPRDIVAAPGDTTQRVYIESIQIFNATTGENPVVKIYTASEILAILWMSDIADTGGLQNNIGPATALYQFQNPLVCTAGIKVSADALSATGDCYVVISGFYDL